MFVSPTADTNVPIQLYYTVADTKAADTVTVTLEKYVENVEKIRDKACEK